MSPQAEVGEPAPSRPAEAWSRTAAGFGTILFLASDLMLFAAFFSAYFVLRGTTAEWPPDDVELDVARAAVATVVLVTSSFTLIAADRAIEHGRRVLARRWLLVTLGLGLGFLVNQVLEYTTLEFGADSHPYGSVFWLLTGLHGLHVAAGLAAITLVLVRTIRARDHRTMLPFATGVSVYWHLVDVVWVGVFLTIWIIR